FGLSASVALMEPASSTTDSVSRRAFQPLLWWVVVSSLLLLWRYHQTQVRNATVQFTVLMEGRPDQLLHRATLNGVPYQAGARCGVGWKKLVVEASEAEPFQTNIFVWYAGQALGNITLARMRGRMELDFSPTVETVRIVGSEERKTLDNITRESLS